MKILYIITSLNLGGAEKEVCKLADSIVETYKCKVDLISLTNKIKIKPKNKDVKLFKLNINKNPYSFFINYIKLINLIKKLKPDIIHSHLHHAIILSRSLKIFFPKLKIISTVHNSINKNTFFTKLLRFTDYFSDLNSTVSKNALRQYLNLKIFNKKNSTFIYNGIEINNYKYNINIRKKIREKENIQADEFVFISISRLIKTKGIFDLLKAFKSLGSNSKVKLIIIGEGVLKPAIIDFVNKNYLNSLVILKSDKTSVRDYLCASDTLINASYSEGFSLISIEGLSNKIPIIATDIPTHKEIISKNARYFTAGDVLSLSKLMKIKKRIREKRMSFSSVKGYERVKEKFSIERLVKEWFMTYKNLMSI